MKPVSAQCARSDKSCWACTLIGCNCQCHKREGRKLNIAWTRSVEKK